MTTLMSCVELRQKNIDLLNTASNENKKHKSELADERRIINDLKRQLRKVSCRAEDLDRKVEVLEKDNKQTVVAMETMKVNHLFETSNLKKKLEDAEASLDIGIREERATRIAAITAVMEKMQILRKKIVDMELDNDNVIAEMEAKRIDELQKMQLDHKNEIAKLEMEKVEALAEMETDMNSTMKEANRHCEEYIQRERDASCAMKRLMEKKLTETIERERKFRNDSISFSTAKASSKVEHYKKQYDDLNSNWSKRESEIRSEERDRYELKLSTQCSSFDKRIAKLRENHGKAMQFTIDRQMRNKSKLVEKMENMNERVATTSKDLRKAKKRVLNTEVTSSKRLQLSRDLKYEKKILEEEYVQLKSVHRDTKQLLNDHQEKMDKITVLPAMKKMRAGRRGGLRWPIHIIQLICEQLVNGTPPSAIPSNLVTMYAINGSNLEEVPCVNFCRQCRTVVQIIGETLAAYRLGLAPVCPQAFFDGTSRRQIPFLNLIFGLLDESGNVNPLTLSSCIFPEDESAESQVDAMIEKVCYKKWQK